MAVNTPNQGEVEGNWATGLTALLLIVSLGVVFGPIYWCVRWSCHAATRRFHLSPRRIALVAATAVVAALFPILIYPGPAMVAQAPWGTVLVAWMAATLAAVAVAAHVWLAGFLQTEWRHRAAQWRAMARRIGLRAREHALERIRVATVQPVERNRAQAADKLEEAKRIDGLVDAVIDAHDVALLSAERLRWQRAYAAWPSTRLEHRLSDIAAAHAATPMSHPRHPALAIERGVVHAILLRRYADGLPDGARNRVAARQAWLDADLLRIRTERLAREREEEQAKARVRAVKNQRVPLQ